MIKAVIIDDEKNSRDALKGMLSKHNDIILITGEAQGCKSGIKLIEEQKPQLVFLDIQMPDGSGFRLLEGFIEPEFHVIFTTAYDQYAIKAIRYSALDYLLKPIDPSELKTAITKAVEKCQTNPDNTGMKVLMNNIQNTSEPKKIVLSTSKGLHVVRVNDIIRCESDDYYTRIFFTDNSKIMISKTLKDVEEMLQGLGFIRAHKSHLVNLAYIKSFLKIDGGYLLLPNEERIPVSRRKKEAILNAISRL